MGVVKSLLTRIKDGGFFARSGIFANSRRGTIFIGRHSYGVGPDTVYGATLTSQVSIGNFCSIAPGVQMLAHVEHPTHLPSTFPLRTLLLKQAGKRQDLSKINEDSSTRGHIKIGHDVWIGQKAIILSGVVIGNGAVIGAGAVVKSDVPPYAIVAGNPAKLIRFRFPSMIIEQLQETKWWELPDESIVRLIDFFYITDIASFIDAVKSELLRLERP